MLQSLHGLPSVYILNFATGNLGELRKSVNDGVKLGDNGQEVC